MSTTCENVLRFQRRRAREGGLSFKSSAKRSPTRTVKWQQKIVPWQVSLRKADADAAFEAKKLRDDLFNDSSCSFWDDIYWLLFHGVMVEWFEQSKINWRGPGSMPSRSILCFTFLLRHDGKCNLFVVQLIVIIEMLASDWRGLWLSPDLFKIFCPTH